MATIEEQFKANNDKAVAGINTMYDNSRNTNTQTLQNAFNASSAAQNAQQQTSQQAFNTGMQDINVQNNRNANNVTQFADVRDVNTGLGSQHQLNLRNAGAKATGQIAFAQQQALQESQRQAAMQEEMYRQRVSQALADNDYKRAAALMDEKNRAQANNEANAKIAASFGQFGGMNAIYGPETAGTMQTMWNAQHPEEAYRMGRIDPETYRRITGRYPAGYTPPSVSGGGGYGGYYAGTPVVDENGKPLANVGVDFGNGNVVDVTDMLAPSLIPGGTTGPTSTIRRINSGSTSGSNNRATGNKVKMTG